MDKERKETEDHESVASVHHPIMRSTWEIQPSGQSDLLCALLDLMERRDEARRREDREREDRWREHLEEREVGMNDRLMEQMEYHHKNQQQDQCRKLADKNTLWKDNDRPTSYLKRFEDIMTDTGIPTAEWPGRLIPLLTGKVLSAYKNNVPRSAVEAYPILKDALLNAMRKAACMNTDLFKEGSP